MSGRHREAFSNLQSCLTDSSRIHLIQLIHTLRILVKSSKNSSPAQWESVGLANQRSLHLIPLRGSNLFAGGIFTVCFYTCLSVILFTGGSTWAGTPPAGTPPQDQIHPPRQVHPPGPGTHPREQRRLLLRTVRILLECILVLFIT